MAPRKPGPAPRSFSALASDRRSGAYPLATEALARLKREIDEAPPHVPRAVLSAWSKSFLRAQPSMGPFRRVAAELDGWPGRGPVPRARLGRFARAWSERLAQEPGRLLRRSARELSSFAGPVATISHSSVVRELLLQEARRGRPREVHLLRSLPGNEALDLRHRLSAVGLTVRLYPDSRVAAAVKAARLVLVGADTVFADGSLLHKRGTRALAREAHQAGVPFVVLAGSSKFVPGPPPAHLPRPALFDRTPAHWITAYWTELGPYFPIGRGPGTR